MKMPNKIVKELKKKIGDEFLASDELLFSNLKKRCLNFSGVFSESCRYIVAYHGYKLLQTRLYNSRKKKICKHFFQSNLQRFIIKANVLIHYMYAYLLRK